VVSTGAPIGEVPRGCGVVYIGVVIAGGVAP
jgi:hypothetical protein